MAPGGQLSGGFHPMSTLLLSCRSSVSCFGAGTSTEKNRSVAAGGAARGGAGGAAVRGAGTGWQAQGVASTAQHGQHTNTSHPHPQDKPQCHVFQHNEKETQTWPGQTESGLELEETEKYESLAFIQ